MVFSIILDATGNSKGNAKISAPSIKNLEDITGAFQVILLLRIIVKSVKLGLQLSH